MRSRFGTATRMACLLAAIAIWPACTPSPQPTPTGTTNATPSTSPAATTSTTTNPPPSNVPTTDPGIPPAARVDSIEGAQEFVKYFMAQFNRSWTESDPTLLVPLCLPTSKTCAAFISTARDHREKKQRYVGTPFEVSAVLGFRWVSGSAGVIVRGSHAAGTVVDATGAVVETVAANSGGLVFELEHQGLWRAQEIKAEAKPT